MRYTKLPGTDIEVSVLAMGCWALSGDFTWGDQDERDSIAAVHAALDRGINFFDTAELYGDGLSERVLGRALKGRREQAVVASKFNCERARRDEVLQACNESLQRLQTDYLDLYQIHWRNRQVPLEETWGALEELKRAGKVRAIGVCNFGPQDLDELLRLGRPTTNQLPYSLLFRAIEYEIVPKCQQAGLGILCYSPLAIGLLTGKFPTPDDVPDGRARSRHFSSKRPLTRHGEPGCEAETWQAMAEIEQVARQLGCSVVQLALAWLLHQPGVTSVLAGIRNAAQAESNAQAVELRLDDDVLKRLDQATARVKEILGKNPDMWETAERSRFR